MRFFRPMRLPAFLCTILFLAVFSVAQAAAPQHGITLFGELKYKPWFRHFDYVNPNAPKGGTLRIVESAAFDSLNPFILRGVSATNVPGYVFEPLMRGSLDEPQSYYGLIAKSITVADDRTTIDIALRPEARFHDGKKVTADDVIFSLETFKTKAHPSYRILYTPIASAEKIDDTHVRFHVADPGVREAPLLIAGLYVLPKHYYAENDFDKTTLKPPVGSGPYRISKVDQGRSIVYERDPKYWGRNLAVNRGQFNFDRIQADVYRDETVAVEAIKSGRYDYREEFIARNFATAYNIPAVKDGKLIKRVVKHKLPSGMQAFIFNMRLTKFQDPRVRRAIGLTLDYEWMNRSLFYDAYTRSSSYFQNTDMMATGLPEGDELALLEPFRDQLPPALFTEPYVVPKTDGTGHDRTPLVKAQQLLDEAGWVLKDGKRTNTVTGEIMRIEFLMRQRTFQRVVAVMQKNLRRLGIESTFRFVDDAQYQKRIDTRDFDMVSIWWNMGISFPGNEQQAFWDSSQADTPGSANLGGVKNPVVDALIGQLIAAHELAPLKAAAKALDRVLLWNEYVIPHWHLGAWRMLYWDKFELPKVQPPYGTNLDAWWMKKQYLTPRSAVAKPTAKGAK